MAKRNRKPKNASATLGLTKGWWWCNRCKKSPNRGYFRPTKNFNHTIFYCGKCNSKLTKVGNNLKAAILVKKKAESGDSKLDQIKKRCENAAKYPKFSDRWTEVYNYFVEFGKIHDIGLRIELLTCIRPKVIRLMGSLPKQKEYSEENKIRWASSFEELLWFVDDCMEEIGKLEYILDELDEHVMKGLFFRNR